jgi:BTB/POZ domain
MHINKTNVARDFGPPFDDADADTILRSIDNLDFRVYRVILSKASPVFKDMFTFPHPPCPGPFVNNPDDDEDGSDKDIDYKDGLPLVRLPESSATLSMLLYAIYPVTSHNTPPPPNSRNQEEDGSLDTLTECWLAADKYEISSLRETLTSRLQSHPLMTRQPLRLFGIAYYLRSQAVLQTAATHTLTLAPLTLDSLGRHVDLVPFIAVRHLVEYHRACGLTAREFALRKADEDGFAEVFLPGWFACLPTGTSGGGGGSHGVCREQRCQFGNLRESRFRLETLEWWRTYMRSFGDRVGERPAMSGTAAMAACANEWEALAKRLCARCRGYAASAMVLAHTILAELLKVEIEDEVTKSHFIYHCCY